METFSNSGLNGRGEGKNVRENGKGYGKVTINH